MARRIILVDIGNGLTLGGVLPSVALDTEYSAALKARGGTAPYFYEIIGGSLPTGLSLDPVTGIVSGTTSTAGRYSITVQVTDRAGTTVQRSFALVVIAEPLTLSGVAPAWTIDVPYSYQYTAAHGEPPYTWASTTLPAGLALDASTGVLSGTPTVSGAPAWTITVTDAVGTSLQLRNNILLSIVGAYPGATEAVNYSADLVINGADLPYSNPRVTAGALPAGLALTLLGQALRLSGYPTTGGTSAFTVAVDSADGQVATSDQNLTVTAAWQPSANFASGERGLWIDPSDLSTMYQDSAGTIPVTAAGQLVGKILDKSGNGNHLSTAAANRPTLTVDGNGKYYLQFAAGSALFMFAPNTAQLALRTASMMSVAGARFDDGAAQRSIYARSKAAGVSGRYSNHRASDGRLIGFYDAPGGTGGGYQPGAVDTSTATRVITVINNRSGGSILERVNAAAFGSPVAFTPDTGTDHNESYRFLLGAYNDTTDTGQINYMNGRIYGLVIRFGSIDNTLRDQTEQWMAGRSGVTL